VSDTGRQAEELAARFLQGRKLSILARNYRCRGGEIDLIAQEGSTLVFVEVRLRRHDGFGGAAASITRTKRERILLAARHYLAGRRPPPCRFDVVLFRSLEEAPEWLRDAFGEP
jgi:putative endonuclease